MKKLLLIGTLLTLALPAAAQTYTNQAAIVGAGPGVIGFNVVGPCNGQVLGWVAGVAQCITTSGTGTVQSVGLSLPASTFFITGSPVTTTGTLTGSFIAQTANTFFAGPGSGAAATPGWRTLVNADIPVPTLSALGGVQAVNPTTHQWINSINTSGVPQLSQPAFTDISGTLAATQCLTPTTSTLGCTQAVNPVTSNWINSISTAGVPSLSQPNFTDLAGTFGIAQFPILIPFSVVANATGSPAQPTNISLSGLIDAAFGNAQGDILYRGATGWAVLAPATAGQVLSTGGAAANPSWTTVSGTGTMTSITAGAAITLTPSSCTTSCSVALTSIADATLLSNISGSSAAPSANTLTSVIDHDITSANVQGSVLYRSGAGWAALGVGTAGQFLQTQGAGANPRWALTTPTTQKFTTGSGTYTTPAGVQWLEITLVGGGGGGGGSSGSGTGGNGGATCWNTTGAACTTPVYSAGGGAGAVATNPGAGGTVTGSGTCLFPMAGGTGNGGSASGASAAGTGGMGGVSTLGGAGGGQYNTAGLAAAANSGSGGGGAGSGIGTLQSGGGGSAGATCKTIISTPAATYTYAVGSSGAGGGSGAAGGAGIIFVTEHYGP